MRFHAASKNYERVYDHCCYRRKYKVAELRTVFAIKDTRPQNKFW